MSDDNPGLQAHHAAPGRGGLGKGAAGVLDADADRLAAGARDEGAPGPRHKIEAAYWDMALVKKLYMDK